MPRDTLAPYSWPRSVSWCLAEGYRKRRSAPPHGPMWLGKDFTFLLDYIWDATTHAKFANTILKLIPLAGKAKAVWFIPLADVSKVCR